MPPRHLAWVLALASGCATAGRDDGVTGVDGNPTTPDSAPPVDALIPVTLSQTSDTTIAAARSRACAGNGYTRENSWYRVFRLADAQITGPLHVTSVQLGIQGASAGQSIELRLGTYSGTVGGTTLDLAAISPLASKTLDLPAAIVNELLDTAIDATVPAGGTLVVEMFAPDHNQTTTFFFAGATAGSESSPGYLRSPHCPANAPVLAPRAMKNIDATAGSLVITVKGTH